MRTFRFAAAAFFLCLATPALRADPQPGVERVWTGVNGKTFHGVFARTFEDGGKKAQFITSAGKVVSVAIENLSEKDREIILVFEGKAPAKPAADVADTGDSFKKLPIADRTKIPALKPEDYGGTDDESIVDALWVSLMWWDAEGIMPVPKGGDMERKAEWLHKELTRNISRGGRGASSLEEAKEGVTEYFEKRLEETGACKAVISTMPDVASLSRFTAGNSIVALKMSMTYSNSRVFSVASVLESMEPDGSFVMHMFGRRFAGKMTASPHKRPGSPETPMYVVTLNTPEAMPDHYRTQGATFFFGDQAWNGALVLEPYVYKEPGKKAPIPGSAPR